MAMHIHWFLQVSSGSCSSLRVFISQTEIISVDCFHSDGILALLTEMLNACMLFIMEINFLSLVFYSVDFVEGGHLVLIIITRLTQRGVQ